MSELMNTRESLIRRWLKIPDHPPADQVDELLRQAHGLCDLIAWIDLHPNASMTEYREQVLIVRQMYPERETKES